MHLVTWGGVGREWREPLPEECGAGGKDGGAEGSVVDAILMFTSLHAHCRFILNIVGLGEVNMEVRLLL